MSGWLRRVTLAMSVAALGVGCDRDDATYTLYRDKFATMEGRIHVATFDTDWGEVYNRSSCQIAADTFSRQMNGVIRYWCEKGRFRR